MKANKTRLALLERLLRDGTFTVSTKRERREAGLLQAECIATRRPGGSYLTGIRYDIATGVREDMAAAVKS